MVAVDGQQLGPVRRDEADRHVAVWYSGPALDADRRYQRQRVDTRIRLSRAAQRRPSGRRVQQADALAESNPVRLGHGRCVVVSVERIGVGALWADRTKHHYELYTLAFRHSSPTSDSDC